MNMPIKNRYLNFMLRITNGFELLKFKSRVTYQLHLGGGRVLCTIVGGWSISGQARVLKRTEELIYFNVRSYCGHWTESAIGGG